MNGRFLLLLRVFGLFLLVDLGLRLKSLDWVIHSLSSLSNRRPVREKSPADLDAIHAVVTAVRMATRYYYRRRQDCLPRALTVFYLLRRRGVAVRFLVGVKKFPFSAHSWVEYDGVAVDDSASRTGGYAVLLQEA